MGRGEPVAVGQMGWRVGTCLGAKCFDNQRLLLNPQPAGRTPPQAHKHTSQGQARSRISNPSTESFLQLTVHSEEVKIDSELNTDCCWTPASQKAHQNPAVILLVLYFLPLLADLLLLLLLIPVERAVNLQSTITFVYATKALFFCILNLFHVFIHIQMSFSS